MGCPNRRYALLLLAVLDGTDDLRTLEAAAGESGLDDLAAAEQALIVRVDESAARSTFRHPLIRSAVVVLSTSDQRRRVHRALAGARQAPIFDPGISLRPQSVPTRNVAALVEEVLSHT